MIGVSEIVGLYAGWYLYIALLTLLFALPIPYVGGGKLLNWKGWVASGVYYTVVMAAVIGGTRAYCSASNVGFDVLGCGIGVMVSAFLLNTVVGALIMWYTRNL